VKGRLLTTISIVLFVAGIVTLNLNSAVWAKDYYSSDSKNTFRDSEMINGKVNTQTNDNGNTQTNDYGNTQTNDYGNTQTNDNGNTQTNDYGNTQTNDYGNDQSGGDGNYQTNTDGSSGCDSECRKTLDNTMGMLDNLIKPTLP
jgi:hypothetical protein